eukprot:98448-Prymnesium_polylepis.1
MASKEAVVCALSVTGGLAVSRVGTTAVGALWVARPNRAGLAMPASNATIEHMLLNMPLKPLLSPTMCTGEEHTLHSGSSATALCKSTTSDIRVTLEQPPPWDG